MSTSEAPWAMTAFGMRIVADICLPGASRRREDGEEPDLLLRSVPRADLEDLTASPRYLRYLHSYEGCGYAMLEGVDGDVLFHYRERALFHLSAGRHVLRCAVSESGTAWQRVLLDTVLWTVSLLKGFELLHAGAVVTSHGLIAVVGTSGAGKTTLATELLRRGGTLFADDILALEARGDEVIAYPGPSLMNLPRSVEPWDPDAWDVLAELGDERWISVHRVPPLPQPVRAIVLLTPGATAAECVVVSQTSLALLPYMVTFTHLIERRRQQFEVAGALAAGASLLALSRPSRADPAGLVDLILESLESDATARMNV
ncbi:MAG TPA: hypothetical protein VHW96_11350 [Solirubrobacteraceae bacterium]|nr:hypothetical protein [Solirubrobacteraceae bacterium]